MKPLKPLLAALAAGGLTLAVLGAGTFGAGPNLAAPTAGGAPAVQLLSTSSPAPAPAATSPAAPTPAAPAPARCETEEWPDAATGLPPNLEAGAPKGFYLGHNDTGWHLEVTHASRDHAVFSGWVSSNGTIDFQRVDDEHNDLARLGPDHHALRFAFNNYGGLDGVHFVTRCADWLEFHLFINGTPAGVEQVFVGHGGNHPPSVPFTIRRDAIH